MNDYIFIMVLVGVIAVVVMLMYLIAVIKDNLGGGYSSASRWTKPDGTTDYEQHDRDCRIINGVHIPNCYGVAADYHPEMWGDHPEYNK